MIHLIELDNLERSRTYIYSDGSRDRLENVTHFVATKSTHRLRTLDGLFHIVPIDAFIRIELDIDNFTL